MSVNSSSNARTRMAVVPGQILSAQKIRLSQEMARVDIPGAAGECSPTVELIMDGEFVQAIDVICNCGRRHRVRCLYENS